jgi:hypothetical protein
VPKASSTTVIKNRILFRLFLLIIVMSRRSIRSSVLVEQVYNHCKRLRKSIILLNSNTHDIVNVVRFIPYTN